MLTVEMNERLTQVGPGTPMGALLRTGGVSTGSSGKYSVINRELAARAGVAVPE